MCRSMPCVPSCRSHRGSTSTSTQKIKPLRWSVSWVSVPPMLWENQPPGEDYVILADPEANRFCVIDKSGCDVPT